MSKELLKNTRFVSEVKRFYEGNQSKIIDIILFGSSVRGKENPSDVDILIVYKDKEDLDLDYELKKGLNNAGINAQITSKKYIDLSKPSFQAREAVLSEGYSLINNVFISRGLGYSNMRLFRYELKTLDKSGRMRFYYALYGRNGSEGILKALGGFKFAETIILCPIENSEQMKEFLERWGINHLEVPVLIPSNILEALKR